MKIPVSLCLRNLTGINSRRSLPHTSSGLGFAGYGYGRVKEDSTTQVVEFVRDVAFEASETIDQLESESDQLDSGA